jgi:hypothetical protein
MTRPVRPSRSAERTGTTRQSRSLREHEKALRGILVYGKGSNAVELLSPEHLKSLLHLGIRVRLSFNAAVIGRVEVEHFWTDRGRHATRRAATIHNMERASSALRMDRARVTHVRLVLTAQARSDREAVETQQDRRKRLGRVDATRPASRQGSSTIPFRFRAASTRVAVPARMSPRAQCWLSSIRP